MATNNSINLKSSGIVSYDGAGVFSALANPLTVANGGQGNTSVTAYAVLCGGTTSTNPVQSIAGVGSSGEVLISNGAGALPTFQAPGGYTLFCVTFSSSPADATTYFLSMSQAMTTYTASGNADTRLYVPKAGTILACYGVVTVGGTLGSAGSSTLSIRLNNTTDTTVSSSIPMTSASNTFNNSGLSIAVSAGDYIEFKWLTPTWATNPTVVRTSISVYIR